MDCMKDNFTIYFLFEECAPDFMRDTGSGDCVACPKGTYSDTAEAASCSSCPEGQTTLGEGTGDASLCHGKLTYSKLY